MQIHELNTRKIVNEVDLVGPNSIFNVGKQVFKNPAALGSSSALGAAQQQADQSSAQKSAALLAKQGYKVGGSVKPVVTTAQQLPAVKANPAVQQQVQNLTSQWMTQSQALKRTQMVPEAEAVAFDPRDLSDPKYAGLLRKLQQQGGLPPEPVKKQTPASELELEKKLTAFKTQFKNWSDPRLQVRGITVDDVQRDPATEQMLDSALSNIAVAMQSRDENLEKAAVAQYFNIAIAAIQAYEQNTQQPDRNSAAARVAAQPAQADVDQQVLQQLGAVGITRAQLEKLGTAMTQAAGGDASVNNTGNPVLNAIARLAGMRVQ
jgi:hypothetical protein